MKRTICMILTVALCLTLFAGLSLTASAANTTSPWSYSATPTRAIYYKSPVMTGNDVRWVQQALNLTVNAGLSVDGSFGPASKAATVKFQKQYGLTQDGSFGPASRAKMVSVLNSMGYYANGTTPASNATWLWPTSVKKTSCVFADNYYHTSHWHRGIDIPCSQGTSVYASRAGVVTILPYDSSRGYCMVIDHGDGYYSEYQHLKQGSFKVSTGDYVQQGTVIALTGNTGSGGYHLHFEIMNLGKTGLSASYKSYFNSYSKYVNVNPSNTGVTITSTNVIRVSTASGVPTAAPKRNGNYLVDAYGINYIFK